MGLRIFRYIVLALIAVCFSSLHAVAQVFSNDILLNTPGLTDAVSHARLYAHGDDLYSVWQGEKDSNRTLFFQRSSDGGRTWLAQEIVIASIPQEDNFDKVTISADDARLYVFWVQHDTSTDNIIGNLSMSFNQGRSWQTQGVATGASLDMEHDDQGNICVVWAGDQIYSKCSTDVGQSWTSPTVVNTTGFPIHPYDVQAEPAIASGGNGKFYTVWTDNRGATGVERYIYVTRSLDGGQTWEQDHALTSGNGPLGIQPDIIADRNGGVIVNWINKIWWGQGETYRYSISTAYSRNSGASWNSGAGMDSYGIAPKFLFDETTGKFFIFWLNDNDHTYRKLQMKYSSDQGQTWSPTVVVGPHHDVQGTNYDTSVSGMMVVAAWENLEPWPGIYFNYSLDSAATWLGEELRVDYADDSVQTSRPAVAALSNGGSLVVWEDARNGRTDLYHNNAQPLIADLVRAEADYIVSCQYTGGGGAYGAINNVQGDPTWIVPRENAMAILGLIEAADYLSDSSYLDHAQLAADYLVSVQDSDGAWADQYNYTSIDNAAKSPTQTAEVMMALYKLGYQAGRYQAMKNGAEFLLSLQDPANKSGLDDGLICGGKDADGVFQTWRWASDNAYAYQALRAAYAWAVIENDDAFADQCLTVSQRIINGMNTVLRDDPVWYTAVDESGNPQGNPDLPTEYDNLPNWISYAPQMLDLPAEGVDDSAIGDWIRDQFRQSDGASVFYTWDEELRTRKSPGYSFQSALSWFDTGDTALAAQAVDWALSSGLKDVDNGGWVDWVEVSPDAGQTAPTWQRFIDTSFYAIASYLGGYDFNSHYLLNLSMPYYATSVENNTGEAAARMILNFIREGAGSTLVDEGDVPQYVRGVTTWNTPMTPDEMDKALGHFDPYDTLVSDGADAYDQLPDGNPYQGYNFTVDAYDPFADDTAMEEYMRDLCHWMAFPVTRNAWYRAPRVLVARPNTPAAVPLFGSYGNWAVIKGFKASSNPNPDPYVNPFVTDRFTVYGFWITDPLITGIGRDTYKTAAECASTFFVPVSDSGPYAGKLVSIAEPPSGDKEPPAVINRSVPKPENLEAILDDDTDGTSTMQVKALSRSAGHGKKKAVIRKKTWRDLVDQALARDPEAAKAFDGKQRGKPLFVVRSDDPTSAYYLVPYGNKDHGTFLVSGVLILDADEGYFKEASWIDTPRVLLPVSAQEARRKVMNAVLQEYATMARRMQRYRWFRYHWRVIEKMLWRYYWKKAFLFWQAKPILVWQPDAAAPNPYQPAWRFKTKYGVIEVSQAGEVK